MSASRACLCSLPSHCKCTSYCKHSLCSFIGFTDACRFLHGPRHARSVRSAWGTASSCELLMCIVDAHRQVKRAPEHGDRIVANRKLLQNHKCASDRIRRYAERFSAYRSQSQISGCTMWWKSLLPAHCPNGIRSQAFWSSTRYEAHGVLHVDIHVEVRCHRHDR